MDTGCSGEGVRRLLGQKAAPPLLKKARKACKARGSRRGMGHISESGDARFTFMILTKYFVKLTTVMKASHTARLS